MNGSPWVGKLLSTAEKISSRGPTGLAALVLVLAIVVVVVGATVQTIVAVAGLIVAAVAAVVLCVRLLDNRKVAAPDAEADDATRASPTVRCHGR